jgi:hypothetical protein
VHHDLFAVEEAVTVAIFTIRIGAVDIELIVVAHMITVRVDIGTHSCPLIKHLLDQSRLRSQGLFTSIRSTFIVFAP